ncbi:MAG: DUF4105 domain-containing protein, partial [Bacteroidia bacterium]|nr:DUF4105 domain-containing protein [Bacteroidia bacterium]
AQRMITLKWAALLLFVGISFAPAQAQPPVSTLSPEAQVSVLTCSPGSELYSIFGHSALRIQDPATRLDWVWNYGVFEFDTPNFVLKFARGKLLYYVLSYNYRHFYKEYLNEKRSIYEQTLDLTEAQKKAIFEALLVNELPDNRYYQYDFFYDNCSTRERDLVAKALGKDLKFHPPQPDDFGTYRQLIDKYLRNDVWADFGIDLLLGSPTDKIADQQGATFLPDYLHQALSTAEVQIDGQWRPLVKSSQTLLQIPPQNRVSFQYGPHILGWSILGLALLFTFLGYRKGINLRGFDVVLFLTLGLLGILMLLFWVGTDHQATYVNLNMLWAFPLHLIFAFTVLMRRYDRFNQRYAFVMLIWMTAFLATSWLLPQSFHAATIPLAMAALVRLVWNWNIRKKKTT